VIADSDRCHSQLRATAGVLHHTSNIMLVMFITRFFEIGSLAALRLAMAPVRPFAGQCYEHAERARTEQPDARV